MITLTNGNIQNPSGLVVPNGSMTFQLNIDSTIIASPFGIIPANLVITFQFDENGNILPNAPAAAAQIYSNLELNPQNEEGLGTYYLVTFYDANGARLNISPMWWQFTQAANSTVNIGEVTPFATVGGNVIFYPTSLLIPAPTPSTLGGVFSNVGAPSQWIRAINTNGSVSLSQPAFSDISGTLSNAQLPSPIIFGATSFSGLITGQANIQLGVVGVTSGQITMEGATSGAITITAPSVAGVAANPILFSNGINIPSGAVFSINTDTGVSRTGAGVIAIGNGTPGNASGTINAAVYQVAGAQIAASNLSNGVTGTGAIVLAASPTLTGTIIAAALTASGIITAPTLVLNAPTPTGAITGVAFGDTTGFGNGTPATAVTTTTLGTGSGPTTPETIIGYLEINVGGTVAWVPYCH